MFQKLPSEILKCIKEENIKSRFIKNCCQIKKNGIFFVKPRNKIKFDYKEYIKVVKHIKEHRNKLFCDKNENSQTYQKIVTNILI